MSRLAGVLVVALAFSTTMALAQSPGKTVTASKLTATFKQLTGDKLLPNKDYSHAGHYRAFDAGAATIARKGKYGTFKIYLVTGADVEAEVADLLADTHTGLVGTPGAANIYWEAGSSIYGDLFWMAKKRYGANVVLTWIGVNPVKKTDKSFKRLHAVLIKATS